ncbi:cobaltochelatase subunit CobN [Comamonas piscis]|uniref:Cobaltochelatase subunit CobN n=1 Tax=Comamonas piscis TaxID=1562974 RepID=A0A7G5EK26_9BURK|nr:cobaltochelatase subunit CobN [Comamonas piscis]QMV74351.1 cobaltochelatase subunit CobN [Comamonas piscis]WSO32797.1 cobaltochelatase subunit CobN [Comamonas piscis]
MHLLAVQPGGFVDDAAFVSSLGQSPADIVILSAADTTLALLAQAYEQLRAGMDGEQLPSVRLANLMYLRQPASVDLYADEVLQHAKLIIIDHLGGESYWPYGTERVMSLCRAHKIALAMFSGDSSEDLNLLQKSTVPQQDCRTLWRYLREGGLANARELFRFVWHGLLGGPHAALPPRPLPAVAVYHPSSDEATVATWQQPGPLQWQPGAPVVMVLFYKAHLQSGNTQVFADLCQALLAQGMNPLPLALQSLKDASCLAALQALCASEGVALILNTTAFSQSSLDTPGDHALAGDIPVLQLILSGSNEQTWLDSTHGLQPRDIAMHVAMPEVDGRIITRAISFKGLSHRSDLTQSDVVQYQAHPERMGFVVELAQRWCQLRRKPNADKRLALVLANYPSSEGRIGNGVGLDTPASVIEILRALAADGYAVDAMPADSQALMELLQQGITNAPDSWATRAAWQSLSLADYLQYFNTLPAANQQAITERWGAPAQDPMLREGRFMVSGLRLGQIFVGVQPARGYQLDALAAYHDPDLVPPHYYLAFYHWLRSQWQADAMVHVGKHGNLEWLPGKSVALSANCWPDLVLGPLPHLYPFIVNDPGEGTQAKRRAQAVIIDHLMPPLTRAESYGPTRDLERMVDEYYDAATLDHKRAQILRQQILAHIVQHDLHQDLGLQAPGGEEEEQQLLNRTDAYLCELKESQIRDGLHIFGVSPAGRLETDTLLALARHPVGDGKGANQSLVRAMARDLGLDFDPLDADWAAAWTGPRPALLQDLQDLHDQPWRHHGDTRERLELLALQILAPDAALPPALAELPDGHTQAVLRRVQQDLRPRLAACGPQELQQLLRGLAGRFVPAGPSGAPTRGRPDVLPTGRNFFSVDTRAIPTQTSWGMGFKSAQLLVERYTQEHGEYPVTIGLSVWGTATMRTGGDDISQAFALMGVRPTWADGSWRVSDFEVLPLHVLGRPRVDVTLRVSGFFRDAFSNVIRLFDAAVQKVAALEDEDAAQNPIRARVLAEAAQLQQQGMDAKEARHQAGLRVFGAKPGSYGAGLQGLIDSGQWQSDEDLATAYRNWGAYAYGQQDEGSNVPETFVRRLAEMQMVLHNQDNREHDVLDSGDYYQFQGGMAAAVRHYSGQQPAMYFGDHSNPESPRMRSLQEEISRVVRSRATNPKWIEGVQRHGYKGAFEIAATVDYLFAFDATARVVRDDQYARVTDAFVADASTRAFMQQHNPQAFHGMCERLLEAIQRGLWQEPGDYPKLLETHLLDTEHLLEMR